MLGLPSPPWVPAQWGSSPSPRETPTTTSNQILILPKRVEEERRQRTTFITLFGKININKWRPFLKGSLFFKD